MHRHRTWISRIIVWSALSWASVGCQTSSTTDAGLHDDGGVSSDGGQDITRDRGPRVISIDGDPNGVVWSERNKSRFLADDDTVVVTRFGHGTDGAVLVAPISGAPYVVPGLDVERRRIGLTVAPTGDIFVSWFVRIASGERLGAVGKLQLSGSETIVVDALKKPVGVLAIDDDLLISNQDLGQILRVSTVESSSQTVVAAIPSLDLMTKGPAGAIFVGSTTGDVYRVESDGTSTVAASGFDGVRGVAYDDVGQRLFVANHVGHGTSGVDHTLHILPIDD